jgi:tetratricopeptide (TPR) repeat protein
MGRLADAFTAYRGELISALLFNLEAHAETLALIRPFFTHGWDAPSVELNNSDRSYLMNNASSALAELGEAERALALHESALDIELEHRRWTRVSICLRSIGRVLWGLNRLVCAYRDFDLALELAELTDDEQGVFMGRLLRFGELVVLGRDADAEDMWRALDGMGRDWDRAVYRPGEVEAWYAEWRFHRGQLSEDVLSDSERVAVTGRNRWARRNLHGLRGEWLLQQGDPQGAAESFAEGVCLLREAGVVDARQETWLALARQRLGTLPDARDEAERLARLRDSAHLPLARLWQAIGDTERATKHALAAYQWAWADGEPYVRRYELEQAAELMGELDADVPELSPYDPAADPPRPSEQHVATAIAELRAEQPHDIDDDD